jgi:hypothetical protein
MVVALPACGITPVVRPERPPPQPEHDETVMAGLPLSPPDVPVVFWLKVGKLVMFAALIVGAVWKDGAAAPPLAGPAKTEFCAALDRVKVNAGVLVAVATEVVNRGLSVPALKLVTVPPPPPPLY